MKPDNQGEIDCKSQPATGAPQKPDSEFTESDPSNSFNNSMKGMPIKGRTSEQVNTNKKNYSIFPKV